MDKHIVPNLPLEEYAARPGINATALKIAHQYSLAHVQAHLVGTFAKESSALDMGRAFHALALEGREDFVVRPSTYDHPKEGRKPWNGNAAACKEWLAANDGALIVSPSEAADLTGMLNTVAPYLHRHANADCELSVFAERHGLPTKVRIDCLPKETDAPVIDLKTCRNANPEAFMRDAIRLGYHIQAAWTLDLLAAVGIKRSEFRLIAVECEAPYAVCELRFHDVPLSCIYDGRRKYRAAFAKVAEAKKTGLWPSYGTCQAEDFAPPWYIKELEATA